MCLSGLVYTNEREYISECKSLLLMARGIQVQAVASATDISIDIPDRQNKNFIFGVSIRTRTRTNSSEDYCAIHYTIDT